MFEQLPPEQRAHVHRLAVRAERVNRWAMWLTLLPLVVFGGVLLLIVVAFALFVALS